MHEDDESQGQELRDRVVAAALEAERRTGRAEETEAELRRGVTIRIARMVGGFVLIGIGIALLPLPGPGWVTIVIGLSLLPFAWAERTISLIRSKVPGIPDEGRIPLRTWIIMGVMTISFVAISVLFGEVIGRWIGDLWTSIRT
ncbi:MAG: PGPGW domain-containing protein [Microthrixaceae bacterium]